MASDESVCIEFIDGHSVGRRGLAWLILDPPDKHVNAKTIFEGLTDKLQQDVHNRFDYWLSGNPQKNWYHGWDEPDYKDCFVFRYKKNNQHQRLYGFLCNPDPNNPSLQVCVLVSHTTKNEWEADKSEKKRMNDLKNNEKIIQALKNIKETCFEEKK
jgi:hypothetical protein